MNLFELTVGYLFKCASYFMNSLEAGSGCDTEDDVHCLSLPSPLVRREKNMLH